MSLRNEFSCARFNHRKRANVAVMVAVVMTVIFAVAAVTIDSGYMYTMCADMQNAVDSAALAGASGLPQGENTAKQRAIQYASQFKVGGDPVVLGNEDVTIGNWEWESKTFTPLVLPDPSGISPNAVRAVGSQENVPLFLASLIGRRNTDIIRGGTALADAGRCKGIWGLEGVTGHGDIDTDSYNSDLGIYGPGNINQNGDLCSNQDIRIVGSYVIRGDAMHGRGYEVDQRGGAGELWGLVGEIPAGVVLPAVDPIPASLNNDNGTIGLTNNGRNPLSGNNLRLTSTDNLTLNPGTYYFSSVRMTGQATLTITGPTEIYVDGGDAFFTGGGIANLTADPEALTIYATGDNVKIAGGADFYGAIIAPETHTTLIGNSNFYGVVISKTVDIGGNTFVHVDEAIVDDFFPGNESIAPILIQ